MRIENSRPHFFKLMFGEDIEKHLRIPPAFIKNQAGEISGTATLTRSSGGHWHVRVWKHRDGSTYLEDGWSRFMKENKLGDNEFLVFRYDGNMHFNVKIFEKTGLERSALNLIPGEETVVVKRSRGRPRKYPIPAAPPPPRERSGAGRPRKHPVPAVPPPRERSRAGRPRRHPVLALPAGDTSRSTDPKTEPFTSKFPFFDCCMTRSTVEKTFLVTIPHGFSESYFPATRTEVLLRNSRGEAWEVVCIYHLKRHFMSGGWSAFARDNNLKLGDTCIFELVQNNVFQVHVL